MRRITMWVAGFFVLLILGACSWVVGQRLVETPSYTVENQDGDIELRAYPELLAAQTTQSGTRRKAANQGFRPLADYIFAKSRSGEKISMTAPVTQTATQGDTEWNVRFIMPSQYSRATLPNPESGVSIITIPAQRVAAIRFSGGMEGQIYADKKADLLAWIERTGLRPTGSETYAYYNDPFTPSFLRRNEILVPVE